MKELHAFRLKDLFDSEIEETKKDIAQQRCFLRGTTDADEMLMFQDNIADDEEYIEVLQDYIDELEELWR